MTSRVLLGLALALAAAAQTASVRPSGSSLGRIRLGASDPLWFTWHVGIPSRALKDATFVEAAAKADALILGSIEGSSGQKVAYEIPKPLDYKLKPGERKAIVGRLRELNVKMRAYRLEAVDTDAASHRKVFEFVKEMGAETIITGSAPPSFDALADEFGINVAVIGATQGRGKRIGVCLELNRATRVSPPKDGLFAVQVGEGVTQAQMSSFFLEAWDRQIKPLFISLPPALDGVDTWERAMQPVMAVRVRQVIDSPHGQIRGPDRLQPDMRAKIEAGIPAQLPAKPKKARKLLVVDLNMWSGHGTIPHGNLMLELFSRKLKAFESVFSNDLENLKYPKIKEYDAVFLNNVVGMVFPDPQVREGLLRFVREGGGLGGVHGTTYAALDWPEFTEALGGWAGEHHVEKQVLKVEDSASPLNRYFTSRSFEHTDEFYHFPASSPYSRDKAHVLLSIDVAQSDLATNGRLCTSCTRPDHDYAMSWIKMYGKGRVFCTPLGHTPILFTEPAWVQHLLAGVQFILGDLDADATPSRRR